MNICANCGQDNRDTASFCNNCGMPLGAAPPIVSAATTPPTLASPAAPPPAVAVPVAALAAGQTLALSTVLHGQYLVLNKLAEGGMGAVYLAQDTKLFDRLCVVKEMLPYYATPDEKAEAEVKFEREARLLTVLRHPGVPQVYDYFIEQDRYYLVMEFVDGDNLEQKLIQAGGPLPEREVIDYAGQVASVLAYIGRQTPPVIHRDIKPANIIVDKNTGQVKLVDFGIAREAAPAAGPVQSSAIGTPGYSPPEQYAHNTEPRSDVFALGATMHHLLSNCDPRQAARLFDYPPLSRLVPGISPDLEALVSRMLESDPARRPMALEVRNDLKAIGQPQTAAAGGPFAFRNGGLAHDVLELAQECDHNWDDGIYHLFNGHFEPWLQALNRHDLAGRAETIRKKGGDQRAGLEEFLRALNPTMPLPTLRVTPQQVMLGAVERGDRPVATIEIENVGRGYLHGDARPLASWARVTPAEFGCAAGEKTRLAVEVDTGQLPEGPVHERLLTLSSNGGQMVVDTQFLVTWQPKLAVDVKRVEFGELLEADLGQQAVSQFTITNGGGGLLEGQLSSSAGWVILGAQDFRLLSGQSLVVGVLADSSQLALSRSEVAAIDIASTAGSLALPARITVMKEVYKQRASRWTVYGVLLLLAVAGWAAALALGLWAVLGGVREQPILAGCLAGGLVIGWLAMRPVRRQVALLDEIEQFYARGDLAAEIPTGSLDVKRLALVVAGTALAGLLLGIGYQRVMGAGWAAPLGITAGAILGALLMLGSGPWTQPGPVTRAAGLPLLGGNPRRFGGVRLLATSLAMAILGLLATGPWLISPWSGNAQFKPVYALPVAWWAVAGLVLAADAYPFLPLRLRWLLGKVRGGLLCILFAYLGWLAGTAIVNRLAAPLVGWYAHLPSINVLLAARYLLVGAAAVAGMMLGVWADNSLAVGGQSGLSRPQRAAAMLRALAPGVVIALAGFILGRVLFGAIGSNVRGWGVLATVVAAEALVVWLMAARPARGVQVWTTLRRIVTQAASAVSNRAVQVPLVARTWTRVRGRLPARVAGDWLPGLSLSLLIGVGGALVVLAPLAAHLLLSLLAVVLVVGVVLLVIGALLWYNRTR